MANDRRIQQVTLNGKTIPLDRIKKITLNGEVLWPVEGFERHVQRVIFNGEVIWELITLYLNIEKEIVWLTEYNDYEDTNKVMTNTTFEVV